MPSFHWQKITLSPEDAARIQALAAADKYRWVCRCARQGCHNLVEVYVSYEYVAGRSSKIAHSKRGYCERHADILLAVHKDDAPPPGLR